MLGMEKYFVWVYVGDGYRGETWGFGPYLHSRTKIIGMSKIHSLTDLLKIKDWTSYQIKMLQNIDPKNRFRVRDINAKRYLFLERLSDDDVTKWLEAQQIVKDLKRVEQQIQNTIPELLKEQDELMRRVKNFKRFLRH